MKQFKGNSHKPTMHLLPYPTLFWMKQCKLLWMSDLSIGTPDPTLLTDLRLSFINSPSLPCLIIFPQSFHKCNYLSHLEKFFLVLTSCYNYHSQKPSKYLSKPLTQISLLPVSLYLNPITVSLHHYIKLLLSRWPMTSLVKMANDFLLIQTLHNYISTSHFTWLTISIWDCGLVFLEILLLLGSFPDIRLSGFSFSGHSFPFASAASSPSPQTLKVGAPQAGLHVWTYSLYTPIPAHPSLNTRFIHLIAYLSCQLWYLQVNPNQALDILHQHLNEISPLPPSSQLMKTLSFQLVFWASNLGITWTPLFLCISSTIHQQILLALASKYIQYPTTSQHLWCKLPPFLTSITEKAF